MLSEGRSQRQNPRFNLAQVADAARSFQELEESQQDLWTETSGSRKWERCACSSSTTSTHCGCVLVSCVRKETAAAAANRSTRYPQMDQAQHTRATPDECRLDVNDTILAEAEESSAEAAAGAEIPQAANSQDGAQARVGEEGALGAFDGISLVSPKRGFAGSSSQREKTTNAEVGHDVEKGEGEMTDGERLIRPLLAIRGLEATQINMCKVALEEWQNTAELFVKRVDKKNKEARSIRNEIYQVVGFYSAFQGLLITAVAQSNLLQCHNVGFPLALSAIATAAAVIGMGQKNAAIRDLKMTIKSETPTRKVGLSLSTHSWAWVLVARAFDSSEDSAMF